MPAEEGGWGKVYMVRDGLFKVVDVVLHWRPSDRLEVRDIGSDANIVGNDALAAEAQKNLEEVGGFTLNASQKEFALALQKTLPPDGALSLDLTQTVQPLRPFEPNAAMASTDVGDVSWTLPTIGFGTATFVPGVAAHTWQAAASTGMSIGQEGMVIAAKVLALTAADLFAEPPLVPAVKVDLRRSLRERRMSRRFRQGRSRFWGYGGGVSIAGSRS